MIAMDDKTMLELAARAAGITGNWSRWHQSYGDLWVEGLDCGGPILWNPLTDDGDALRLAVKLGLLVDVSCAFIAKKTAVTNGTVDEAEPHGSDPYAATRRAIVRAAAEIGKKMGVGG